MNIRLITLVYLLALVCLPLAGLQGCAAVDPYTHKKELSKLPPVLEQDELIRSYVKLGRIQVTREVYHSDGSISPDIRSWGFTALRLEAAKLGADAVILPELTGTHNIGFILPATEYRASGIAIKFK